VASKDVDKRVLVKFDANLVTVVGESFIEDGSERYGRHFVFDFWNRYAGFKFGRFGGG